MHGPLFTEIMNHSCSCSGVTHLALDEIHDVSKIDIVIVILNVGPQNNLNLIICLQ